MSAGGDASGRRWARHQYVQFDDGENDADLRRVCRHQGRGGTTDAFAGPGLGPRRITVNIISPGPTETELFTNGKTPEQIQQFAQASAFGRLGQPMEIAEVVAFLASEAAGWVTGQNIRVNGGIA